MTPSEKIEDGEPVRIGETGRSLEVLSSKEFEQRIRHKEWFFWPNWAFVVAVLLAWCYVLWSIVGFLSFQDESASEISHAAVLLGVVCLTSCTVLLVFTISGLFRSLFWQENKKESPAGATGAAAGGASYGEGPV